MDLVDYGKLFMGIPYKWGGSHPAEGYDCSGFVQELLASQGIDPKGDQTAQMLFTKFIDEDGLISPAKISRNDLLFFGKSKDSITHIAIAVTPKTMLEAGGGGSATNNVKDAISHQAMIRVRPIRNDLVAVLRVTEQIDMSI